MRSETIAMISQEAEDRAKAHMKDVASGIAYRKRVSALAQMILDADKSKRLSAEVEQAVVLANKVLDRVGADPDDDLAILAREFLRAHDALGFDDGVKE